MLHSKREISSPTSCPYSQSNLTGWLTSISCWLSIEVNMHCMLALIVKIESEI